MATTQPEEGYVRKEVKKIERQYSIRVCSNMSHPSALYEVDEEAGVSSDDGFAHRSASDDDMPLSPSTGTSSEDSHLSLDEVEANSPKEQDDLPSTPDQLHHGHQELDIHPLHLEPQTPQESLPDLETEDLETPADEQPDPFNGEITLEDQRDIRGLGDRLRSTFARSKTEIQALYDHLQETQGLCKQLQSEQVDDRKQIRLLQEELDQTKTELDQLRRQVRGDEEKHRLPDEKKPLFEQVFGFKPSYLEAATVQGKSPWRPLFLGRVLESNGQSGPGESVYAASGSTRGGQRKTL